VPEAAATPPQPAASGAQPGTWIDPYRAYNFTLEIAGVSLGHFVECTGMGARVNAIRYQEGGSNQVHMIPGPMDYGEVTLRYGLTESRELWDWFLAGMEGRVDRRDISVLMTATDGKTEVLRWNLFGAWPTEWRAAPLDALAREVAIESVTLVYESIGRIP
jgi:phage tail-like protein